MSHVAVDAEQEMQRLTLRHYFMDSSWPLKKSWSQIDLSLPPSHVSLSGAGSQALATHFTDEKNRGCVSKSQASARSKPQACCPAAFEVSKPGLS